MTMTTPDNSSADIATIRHLLATLAYRAHRIIDEVPASYPDLDAGAGVRSPHQILCHMTRVLQYASKCFDPATQPVSEPLPGWQAEIDRFDETLRALDRHFALGQPPQTLSNFALLQGPIADALTHAGQLATLRRLAGSPVPGENFMKAEITLLT